MAEIKCPLCGATMEKTVRYSVERCQIRNYADCPNQGCLFGCSSAYELDQEFVDKVGKFVKGEVAV